MTVLWLVGYHVVKRRFAKVNASLSEFYASSIAVPPHANADSALVLLCVDLLRKQHCTVPFDDLTDAEQKLVLHTRAIEVLPRWMSSYAACSLWPAERALISRLRGVHTSRPNKQVVHFGAIKRQQQLRSSAER